MKEILRFRARYTVKDKYTTLKYRVYFTDGTSIDKTVQGKKRNWKGKQGKYEAEKYFYKITQSAKTDIELNKITGIKTPMNTTQIDTTTNLNDVLMFSDTIDSFIAYRANMASASGNKKYTDDTLKQNKSTLNKIFSVYGDFNVLSAQYTDITDIFNTMKKYYSTGGSFAKMKSILSQLFIFVKITHNYPDIINISDVQSPYFDAIHKKITKDNIFTLEELNLLTEAIERDVAYSDDLNKERLLTLSFVIKVLFWTGMRISECLPITYNKIYKVDNTSFYNIDEIFYQNKLYKRTKTKNSARIVAFLNPLLPIIKERRNYLKKFYGYNDDWYLCGIAGNELKYPYLNKKFRIYSNKLLKKETSLHKLRNSHITYIKSLGITSDELKSHVGHIKSEMTDYYTIENQEKERELMLKIDDILGSIWGQ